MTYGRKIEPTETLAALYEDDSTYRDDWEAVVAEQVSALSLSIGAEVVGTGGGCTAVVSTDGATDVVLTTMDGSYLFGVYRVSDEHPDIHGWYPEQSLWGSELPETATLDDAAAVFASLVAEYLTEDTPYLLQAFGVETWDLRAESLHASVEDALDVASNLATWAGDVQSVRVIDARTGRHDVHTFTSQSDALAVYERAIGRC